MKKTLDIVMGCDDKYLPYFSVALSSLLETNRDIIGRVFLLHSVKNQNKLKQTLEYFHNHYQFDVEAITINASAFSHLKISNHLSRASYNRLLAAHALPDDITAVLYLDSDILVVGDLSGLLKLDFKGEEESSRYLYAVEHKLNQKFKERIQKKCIEGDRYFNAGVLFINLKQWREDRITEKLLEVADKHGKFFRLHDQDILNFTFENNWGELDYSYNVFGLNLSHVFEGDQLSETKEENYKIIHFITASKPWHYFNKHPYKYQYQHYLQKMPFKKEVPDDLKITYLFKRVKHAIVRRYRLLVQ